MENVQQASLRPALASQSPKIIVLEGNIAAGKTTLAKSLATALDYEYFIEPTTENPYLKRYYEKPREYGETMQIWFLHQRYDTYVKALELFIRTGLLLSRKNNIHSSLLCRPWSCIGSLHFQRLRICKAKLS